MKILCTLNYITLSSIDSEISDGNILFVYINYSDSIILMQVQCNIFTIKLTQINEKQL